MHIFLYITLYTPRNLATSSPDTHEKSVLTSHHRTIDTNLHSRLFVSCSGDHTRPRDLSLTEHAVAPQDLELAGEEREESAAHLQGLRCRGAWTQLSIAI